MKKNLFILLVMIQSNVAYGQRYIFYLHGRIIEEQGINAVDTINGYGAYKYNDILDSFRHASFKVINAVRGKNINPLDYANKIVKQIDSLIDRGIKPDNITVIGASKGAIISMFISSYLKSDSVNFVFLAGCDDDILQRFPEIKFYGNILSIYEKSDEMSSCVKFKKSSTMAHYKELELNTGLKHGFLYRPISDWIKPAIKWANKDYN